MQDPPHSVKLRHASCEPKLAAPRAPRQAPQKRRLSHRGEGSACLHARRVAAHTRTSAYLLHHVSRAEDARLNDGGLGLGVHGLLRGQHGKVRCVRGVRASLRERERAECGGAGQRPGTHVVAGGHAGEVLAAVHAVVLAVLADEEEDLEPVAAAQQARGERERRKWPRRTWPLPRCRAAGPKGRGGARGCGCVARQREGFVHSSALRCGSAARRDARSAA